MARAIDPANAPYKVSRAALRERYGARSIDASSRQSPFDSTPSGRAAYLAEQSGKPLSAGMAGQATEFNEAFRFRLGPETAPRMLNRAAIQNGQPADVAPVLPANQRMANIASPLSPISFGLMPETNAGDLSEFLPSPGTPLTNWALPKPKSGYLGSVIKATSKWRQPV